MSIEQVEESGVEAFLAIHALDRAWAKTSSFLGVFVRYADDLVILCFSQSPGRGGPAPGGELLGPLGLRLNLDKPRIVCLTRGMEGFEPLGFHCHKVQSWKWRGRWYLQHWRSHQAMAAVRERISRHHQPALRRAPGGAGGGKR